MAEKVTDKKNEETPQVEEKSPEVTQTPKEQENVVVASPTEVARNRTQVKGGRYKRGDSFFNAKGEEIE